MSKKIIDWDELRAELLSDSDVKAAFDAEERKERLREMLAQWRNHVLPARHFSGRGIKRDQTLWGSFMFVTPEQKVYYSGDSGYGPHFRAIGEQFGEVDLAIMSISSGTVLLNKLQTDMHFPLVTGQRYQAEWDNIDADKKVTASALRCNVTGEGDAQSIAPAFSGKYLLVECHGYRRYVQPGNQICR